jgi:hypothetical protein
LDIHAKFSGDVAATIDEMIRRGRASTKTEAIRLAILDYRYHHLEDEEDSIRHMAAYSNRDIWEDEKEDKTWAKYLKEEKK